jgi:hypothetical protein
MSMLPLINKGDALFHIACEKSLRKIDNITFANDHFENVDPVNS